MPVLCALARSRTEVGMDIIEAQVVAKGPDRSHCEDVLFVGEDFVAVIDGATDKSGVTVGGRSPGRAAAIACQEALGNLEPESAARHAIDVLSESVARIGAPRRADRPSAAICIFSRHRREVWQVGDVEFAFFPDQRRPVVRKRIDVVVAEARAAFMHALLAEGATVEELRVEDPGRELVLDLLAKQYVFRNRLGPYGYGAIDGLRVPDELLVVTQVPDGARELVIHSDGYPVTLPTLAEAERELGRLLEEDPLCIDALRGTKAVAPGNASFDDRAYVRLRLV